ncbi:MAG: hypothetical protein K6F39_03580 [Lachnospiraceae bacterium]|nr:hypothetical protein [Lachnospiraceae bacterium]
MKKRVIFLFAVAGCVISLTACASQQIEMSEEDEQKVVNYAADVIAEHNVAVESSLANITDSDKVRIVKLDLAAAGVTDSSTEEATENAEGESAPEMENSVGMAENSETEETVQNVSIAQALGISDFDIAYTSYEITDEYPKADSSESSMNFTISPGAADDKLLVLHFNIFNSSDETKNCDILDLTPSFRLGLNDKKHSFLTTLLLNDLATFDHDIEAGQAEDAVLIAEISSEKAESIESLTLIVRTETENYEIALE